MDCAKCSGKGVIPRFGFVAAGKCFMCKGTGKVASYSPEELHLLRLVRIEESKQRNKPKEMTAKEMTELGIEMPF